MNKMKSKWISCTSTVKFVLFSLFIVLKNLTSCDEEVGSHVILKRQSIPEMDVEASCEMVCKSRDEDCSFECYLKPVFPKISTSPQTPNFVTTNPSVQTMTTYAPPKISKLTQTSSTVTKTIKTNEQRIISTSPQTPNFVTTNPSVQTMTTYAPPKISKLTQTSTTVTKTIKPKTKEPKVLLTSTATLPKNTPTTTKPLMYYTPDEKTTTVDYTYG